MAQSQGTERGLAAIDLAGLQSLLDCLRQDGFRVAGPVVRDGAIVYDTLTSTADLPTNWTDEQAGGHYRLRRRDDDACFGFAVGPHSWKRFLFPPTVRLWSAEINDQDMRVLPEEDGAERLALIGVRACEIEAIGIQDQVFLHGSHADSPYAARRRDMLILAVNCTQPGGTCFCASMDTGPRVSSGFDLALTEIVENGSHLFLVESGTEAGRNLLARIPHAAATAEQESSSARAIASAASSMGRVMDTDGIRDLLHRNFDHPRWDEVASRCLTCANCTMVCPTCFCATVEDVTDLTGRRAERRRRWDSCFTLDFSYIHGGAVRPSAKARYRQWMTHKLASWIDQFGRSGCVGCGRCITWCPVGIDITEEVRAIREGGITDSASSPVKEIHDGNS